MTTSKISSMWLDMTFSKRLTALRKDRGMTQKGLAEAAQTHITQIQRYESGETQPTLDALKRIALALHVSTDYLVFDDDERGPDDDLKLMFEAVSQFTPEDKKLVSRMLQGLIIQNQANRWSAPT